MDPTGASGHRLDNQNIVKETRNMVKETLCRACQAPIIFIKTTAGKTMPKTKGPFRCFIYQTEGGGVVGEFVCDSFTEVEPGEITKRVLTDTMLTKQEALDYAAGKTVYLWRIRSLVDYPEPKPLSAYGLDRPPQSWCYVKGGDTGE
jgi:hypothetical protein